MAEWGLWIGNFLVPRKDLLLKPSPDLPAPTGSRYGKRVPIVPAQPTISMLSTPMVITIGRTEEVTRSSTTVTLDSKKQKAPKSDQANIAAKKADHFFSLESNGSELA